MAIDLMASLTSICSGLDFMRNLLKLLVEDVTVEQTANIGPLVKRAYEMSLVMHHNWMSKQLFKVNTAPGEKDNARVS